MLGFNIPYGYNYRNGRLEINKSEEIHVKKIFELYESGMSMSKIANFLNLENVPTKRNRSWGSETVSKILKNPLYCGIFHWEDIEHADIYPSIINEDTFHLVQKIRKSKKYPNNHN
jgi:site-specific DNA recombinase